MKILAARRIIVTQFLSKTAIKEDELILKSPPNVFFKQEPISETQEYMRKMPFIYELFRFFLHNISLRW